MKKNVNERCPLQVECERKCKHKGTELECDYYATNARPGYFIDDQEEMRQKQYAEAERELYESELAEKEADERIMVIVQNPDDVAESFVRKDINDGMILPGGDSGKLVYLPVAELFPHPDNPRKNLGDLDELIESIRENGIFQNLTVVRREEGGYTVIIGHRRLAAAKAAGLTQVPCVVAEMSIAQQLSTMLLENMQRSDLTVFEQAQGFQMMLDLGETVDSVAKQTGFSTATVRRRVKMMELDQNILKEVSDRQLLLTDFDKLAQIDDIAARNECLKEIGTARFNQSYETKMRKQIVAQNLPKVKKQLEQSKAKPIERHEQWSGSYISREYIQLNSWDGISPIIPADLKGQVYYFLNEDYGSIRFYTKKEKAKPVKKTDAEIEEQKRKETAWQTAYELNEIAYKLRSDFVSKLSLGQKNMEKMLMGAISSIVLRSLTYFGSDRKAIVDMLSLDDSKHDPKIEEKAMDALGSLDADKLPALIYANFGDGADVTYIRGYKNEYPCHARDERLDALYTWLCSLGYEMSDVEKSLQDGTHDVFHAKEGA